MFPQLVQPVNTTIAQPIHFGRKPRPEELEKLRSVMKAQNVPPEILTNLNSDTVQVNSRPRIPFFAGIIQFFKARWILRKMLPMLREYPCLTMITEFKKRKVDRGVELMDQFAKTLSERNADLMEDSGIEFVSTKLDDRHVAMLIYEKQEAPSALS